MLFPNREAFTDSISFVNEVTFMIKCTTMIRYNDTLSLPKYKMLLTVNFETDIALTLIKEENLCKVVKLIEKN